MTGDDIGAAIEALLPEVEQRADEIAALRRLPGDLVTSLRRAGAFRIALPRARGGPEMTPRRQAELIEVLSRANPSVGWCVMIGSDSPYWAAFLDQDAAAELFADPDAISAGLVMPAGRAEPRDGGYVVNGRWAFGSGCTHADVIIGGCLVVENGRPRMAEDGTVDYRVVAAPASAFEILDTWHTIGLAGSGSNDYTTTDLFVPAEHTFSFSDPSQRDEPLYAFEGTFVSNMPGVPLGIARRAIDLVRDVAGEKVVVPELVKMGELPRVQLAVARAEAMLGSARAYVYETLDRLWAEAEAGREVGLPLRYAISLSRLHSFRVARDVVQLMCDTAGAGSVYATNPLERLQRDIITINQHVVAQDRVLQMVGASMLTGAPMMPAL